MRVQFPRIASSNGGMKLILMASRFSVFLFMFVIVESSSQQLYPIPPEEVWAKDPEPMAAVISWRRGKWISILMKTSFEEPEESVSMIVTQSQASGNTYKQATIVSLSYFSGGRRTSAWPPTFRFYRVWRVTSSAHGGSVTARLLWLQYFRRRLEPKQEDPAAHF